MAAGYQPELGARPLRRAIRHLLEDNLAEEILSGRIKEGDSIVVDVDDQVRLKSCGHSSQMGYPPLQPRGNSEVLAIFFH